MRGYKKYFCRVITWSCKAGTLFKVEVDSSGKSTVGCLEGAARFIINWSKRKERLPWKSVISEEPLYSGWLLALTEEFGFQFQNGIQRQAGYLCDVFR